MTVYKILYEFIKIILDLEDGITPLINSENHIFRSR
jgi:hypothetical protein